MNKMKKHSMVELGYKLCANVNVAYKKQGRFYLVAEFAGEKGRYNYPPIKTTNKWSANKILAIYGATERF